MSAYTAAVVGAGSQGKVHIDGYRALEGVTVTAVADVKGEVAAGAAASLGVPRWYDNYQQMLDSEHPDLVSVCTPPANHLEVVRSAIGTGAKAVHCEKPMGTTFGEARELYELARKAGVQLTFNLQRRLGPLYRHAKRQIEDNAIGELVSIEGYCPNLPDWGSHICDVMLFCLDDIAPSWVMGQVDVKTNHYVYGLQAETTSVTLVQWPSGLTGHIVTGREPYFDASCQLVRSGLVINGTEGRIVVCDDQCLTQSYKLGNQVLEAPFDRDTSTWDGGVDPSVRAGTASALADVVESLGAGREPLLSASRALAGAEIIFATYESSRSRCRVALPLEITDNPLVDGLAKGYWCPAGELWSTY